MAFLSKGLTSLSICCSCRVEILWWKRIQGGFPPQSACLCGCFQKTSISDATGRPFEKFLLMFFSLKHGQFLLYTLCRLTLTLHPLSYQLVDSSQQDERRMHARGHFFLGAFTSRPFTYNWTRKLGPGLRTPVPFGEEKVLPRTAS